MDRGHHFPIRIKGELCQPWILTAGNFFIDPMGFPQMHQRGFRRVPNRSLFVHCRITAQQCRPQQRLLHRVPKISFLRRNDRFPGIELSDRHAILCQRSGLIRTDDRYTSKTFHRLKFPDNRMFFRHLLCSKGKHNGNDGAQCLRDRCNCQRYCKQEGSYHVFFSYQYAYCKQNCT